VNCDPSDNTCIPPDWVPPHLRPSDDDRYEPDPAFHTPGRPALTPPCRYAHKRTFASEVAAFAGAGDIEEMVKSRGQEYVPLHPYPCPDDAAHWHLSSYEQGHRTCPVCEKVSPAWNGGKVWVIAAHGSCPGEGSRVRGVD
jgi:hypothetical protein